MMGSVDKGGVVDAWRAALGADKVIDDAAALDRLARSTHVKSTRPCCILRPTDAAEVQAVVRIANDNRVPLYPISGGRNWGYGDACAPVDGTAVVDLSAMNRIVEVNRELAYCVVEPGVTQGQLYETLQGTGLWMDATGAGPDASIVGNALDRGFGHTRYGDHSQTVCGLEVVLGNGEIVRTGFLHNAHAKAARVYPYGLGPDVNGLFFQSNFGIVTQMGVWLMPEPEDFVFFYLTAPNDGDIGPIVEALRPLRMDGLLNSAVHVANDYRLFSAKTTYPFDSTGGKTPLPADVRSQLRRELGAGAWNLSGSITGTRAYVRHAAKALRRATAHVGRLRVIDDKRLAFFERVAKFLPLDIGAKGVEQLRVLKPNYGLLKGIPAPETVGGAQWRVRNPAEPGTDPRDLGCGLIWISPVLPMRRDDAERVMAIVAPAFAEHGFEPLMTFTLLNERSMVAVIQISFDKADAAESERALACYETVLDQLVSDGYLPYRVGPFVMERFADANDPFWQTAQAMKAALDPNGIIAPGRYVPRGVGVRRHP